METTIPKKFKSVSGQEFTIENDAILSDVMLAAMFFSNIESDTDHVALTCEKNIAEITLSIVKFKNRFKKLAEFSSMLRNAKSELFLDAEERN